MRGGANRALFILAFRDFTPSLAPAIGGLISHGFQGEWGGPNLLFSTMFGIASRMKDMNERGDSESSRLRPQPEQILAAQE